jgi:hypothetical protein
LIGALLWRGLDSAWSPQYFQFCHASFVDATDCAIRFDAAQRWNRMALLHSETDVSRIVFRRGSSDTNGIVGFLIFSLGGTQRWRS